MENSKDARPGLRVNDMENRKDAGGNMGNIGGNHKVLRITAGYSGRFSPLAALILCICLAALPGMLFSVSAEGIQDCHRVTNSYKDTKQANKSVIRLWQTETALPEVTEEINGIARSWAEELGPELPAAKNNGASNSRLEVEIRTSRTGLTWMSFMIQARTIFHRKITDQRLTTRTYNMITGQRITLGDVLDGTDSAWEMISQGVREGLRAYWPEVEPEEEKLEELCSRENLEQADFTLHGMSLVLHYPASLLYEDKHTLMEVTFFYPDIREHMSEDGWIETDNLSYYKTCALTFDDGPSSSNTPKVLNSLLETGERATFFVIGNRIADYYYLVQREHDEGNAVASHNWHHGNVNKSSGSALRAMPEKVNKAMIKYIGIPVRYDRVPGGRYPGMIEAGVGWAYIQWSLDTYDWRGGSTAGVMSKVRKKIQDGDIILCHDTKDNTPESARQIIRYLQEEGYLMLTVDELFAKDGVTLEKKHVYYRCTDGDTSMRKD